MGKISGLEKSSKMTILSLTRQVSLFSLIYSVWRLKGKSWQALYLFAITLVERKNKQKESSLSYEQWRKNWSVIGFIFLTGALVFGGAAVYALTYTQNEYLLQIRPFGQYIFPLAVLALFCFLAAVVIAIETREQKRIMLKPIPPPRSA